MDIAALSMAMSQSNVKELAGISVMKIAMDTSKQTGDLMTEMIKNIAVDFNVGQNLDAMA